MLYLFAQIVVTVVALILARAVVIDLQRIQRECAAKQGKGPRGFEIDVVAKPRRKRVYCVDWQRVYWRAHSVVGE